MRKRLFAALLSAMLLFVSLGAVGEETADAGEWLTFLLVCNEGNVNERGDVGNTSMVFSVNPELGVIKQVIARWDMFIHDPDYPEYQLLDQPFRDGGVEKTLEVFNLNFDQSIDRYLSINYLNLAFLIDAFGGVDTDVSRAEWNAINGMLGSKVATLENQMQDLGMDAASFTSLVDSYYLANYGPDTHLTGLQAVSYGWLQFDSVYDCCMREVEVISQLFFKASNFVREKAFFFTNDTDAAEIDAADKTLRFINLDAVTDDDYEFLYKIISPIFTRSYHNLERDEINMWMLAILRCVYNAQHSGTTAFDMIEFRMLPDVDTRPYELSINNVRGLVVDFEANAQVLTEFLTSTEGTRANALIGQNEP